MTNTEGFNEKEKKLIENYLKSYHFCRKLLAMKKYEDKYFETLEWESETPVEFSVLRAKMYEVRHFILGMRNCNEKAILYYHYVRGDTVERCAELLGISRSSGFRLKKKALKIAYFHAIEMKKELVEGVF